MTPRGDPDRPGPGAFDAAETPLFDGETFRPGLDGDRLGRQVRAVFDLMKDGRWRTLQEVSDAVSAPAPSVSARLRDLRKPKFGGWNVARRRRGNPREGLFEYQLSAFARPEPKP